MADPRQRSYRLDLLPQVLASLDRHNDTYISQAEFFKPNRRLVNLWGNAAAQNNLGLSYSNGEGVLKDSVLAHMWFNIAGANGNEAAREGRDNLERDMTRDEITRATELARACMASDYQDCER